MTVATTGRPIAATGSGDPAPADRPDRGAATPGVAAASRPPSPARWPARRPRPVLGVRAGQIVAAQVAVALVGAALGRGVLATAGAVLVAVLLLSVAWVRLRGRWLFEWLGTATGHLTRRRVLAPSTDPAALLALVAPDASVHGTELAGDLTAVVGDPEGLTVLLELTDPGGLLGDGERHLPTPAALLPPAGPDAPPVRIQLLLAGAPAPVPGAGGSQVATSYRQLTEGRVPGYERAVLAVRALRVDGWSDEELRRALAGALRKVVRRLAPVTARPLGEEAALRVLGELAHHDGGQPARESWRALRLGGLVQSTHRLRRWPDPRTEGGRRLVPRLLGLPATAITVLLSAGPHGGDPARPRGGDPASLELSVRLAAGTPGDLSVAEQALRRLVHGLGGAVRRLDGDQLPGLTGTLPLARAGGGVSAVAGPLDAVELPLGTAGLMIGLNRHGLPVTLRLFRPEATRIVLVGGVRVAQLVAVRAMALGARIVVQTARPRAWEPFVRGVGVPGGAIVMVPPGRPVGGAGSPLRPLLLVVDAGPVAADPTPEPGWQATLVVRDELTTADADALARADLAVLQPLDAAEATVAGTALGLGGSAQWLTRIREDMVAVVNRRALRWALVAPTLVEAQLIGPPTRR
ncbi:type VII secretion protein EccE [Micromonospora pallida]|uniref:Type VII secretion protein EccE n=1 Tax=Micromonospora pallida TaxID=145854 RepID=A0A1C6T7U6_9ACTN|nr:type VII secretion protein EccE [Micromonospora pallida]SCL37642.1 type VII secretion protein EccE [Micromonospora pallida]